MKRFDWATKSMISFLSRLGSMDEMRKREIPVTSFNCSISSKRVSVLFPSGLF